MQKRILMIDDDVHMRRMVAIYLKGLPYELISVGSGRLALHKLQEQTFDLILSDIQMPGMDGIELIKIIREKFPQLPVIVLSAYESGKFKQELDRFNFLEMLPKPFDRQSLLQIMERFLKAT